MMKMDKSTSFLSFYKIDKDLLPPKILYVLFYGAAACLMPFLPIWFSSLGLSAAHIGFLGGLRPLMNFFGAPFFGALADRLSKHKAVLIFAVVASCLARFLVWTFSDVLPFALFATIMALGDFSASSIGPLLDSIVIGILGPDRKDLYGRQRMFGTIITGLTAFGIGTLVVWLSDNNFYFYTHFGVTALLFLYLTRFTVSSSNPASFWKGIKILVSSWEAALFFFVVWIMGVVVGFNSNFLFLRLKELGGTSTLMGLSVTFACVSEVPCLFFSGNVIQKVSKQGVLCMALLALTIRMTCYSLLVDPWMVLPVELLHGFTFGLMWPACIQYVQSISPPGLISTVIGLLVGVNSGFGNSTGGMVGGYLYERYGAVAVFQLGAILSFVSLCLFGTFQLVKWRKEGKEYVKLEVINSDETTLQIESSEEDVIAMES